MSRLVLAGVGLCRGGVTLLDDLHLQVASGAPTALVGPNGAGKSSLLRVVMGLLTPDRGQVDWGEGGGGPTPRLAYVLQRPVMLRRSVMDNVVYALACAGVPRALRHDQATRLLAQVNLAALAHRPAPRLSGGERQRLALARALARTPQWLLLDEPTASLDPAATLSVEQVVRDIAASGVKVVFSTHDLGEAGRLAGDIVLLHRGRVIEHTAAGQFLSQPVTADGQRFIQGQLLL